MYGIYRNLYSLMHLSKSIWWEEVGWRWGGGGGGALGKQAKPRNLNSKLFFGGGVNALPGDIIFRQKGTNFPLLELRQEDKSVSLKEATGQHFENAAPVYFNSCL